MTRPAHVAGEARGLGSIVQRPQERALLHVEQRLIEPQQVSAANGMALGELPGPAAAPGPGLRGERGDRRRACLHQIFSMLTRNALNSGVRELASPTNGVSALASQLAPLVGSRSAAMPTKPQWIGIPMW